MSGASSGSRVPSGLIAVRGALAGALLMAVRAGAAGIVLTPPSIDARE